MCIAARAPLPRVCGQRGGGGDLSPTASVVYFGCFCLMGGGGRGGRSPAPTSGAGFWRSLVRGRGGGVQGLTVHLGFYFLLGLRGGVICSTVCFFLCRFFDT